MAGAGYKLFSTGDVLSASDVNTYLQQQTVMVFASAAARTTALSGVLAEGMVSYLKDTDVVEIYTGAAWVSLDDPNAIQNSIVDAKGDIISATADNTPARLAVGANNTVLTADSSTATGLKWATPSSGGMTLLSTTTLSGASTTISSIDQTYTNLYAFIYGMSNATADGNFIVRPNNATSSYYGTTLTGSTFATIAGGGINFPIQPRTAVSNMYVLNIPNYYTSYTSSSVNRILISGWGSNNSGDFQTWGVLSTGSAVTSLVFLNGGGNFSTGTVLLYGVK